MFKYVYAVSLLKGVLLMNSYLLALLAVAMLALAGCGAKEQATTQQPTQEVAQEEQEAQKATGPGADLANLLTKKQKLEYQITYEVHTIAGDQDMKSTMLLYSDGGNRQRTDIVIPGTMESRTYVIDRQATICNKAQNKWTCEKAEQYQSSLMQSETTLMSYPSTYDIIVSGTKQVLGKTTTCYHVEGKNNPGIIDYCFFEDSVPAYWSVEYGPTTTEMTALLYGKDVAETVWVIPT